jgi:hypothetical protein
MGDQDHTHLAVWRTTRMDSIKYFMALLITLACMHAGQVLRMLEITLACMHAGQVLRMLE